MEIFVGVIFSWRSPNNEIKTRKFVCNKYLFPDTVHRITPPCLKNSEHTRENFLANVQLFYHLFEQQQHNDHASFEAYFRDKDSPSAASILYLLIDMIWLVSSYTKLLRILCFHQTINVYTWHEANFSRTLIFTWSNFRGRSRTTNIKTHGMKVFWHENFHIYGIYLYILYM